MTSARPVMCPHCGELMVHMRRAELWLCPGCCLSGTFSGIDVVRTEREQLALRARTTGDEVSELVRLKLEAFALEKRLGELAAASEARALRANGDFDNHEQTMHSAYARACRHAAKLVRETFIICAPTEEQKGTGT
jgi:hypothetical protein